MSMDRILSALPAVNAALISTSGLFIIRGVRAIRRGQREKHRLSMLTATGLAALFFLLYVIRIGLGGGTPFAGPPAVKWIYFFILITHVALATVQTPMVMVTLWQALRGNFAGHRKIARVIYPIWLYVSFTGVLVFGLLHYPYP